LCSDALTGFISMDPQKDEHNRQVRDATKRLFREVIPALAVEIEELARLDKERFSSTNNLNKGLCGTSVDELNKR